MRYTREEVNALHLIFKYTFKEIDVHHNEDNGSPLFIYPNQIFNIIDKLGRNDEERTRMKKALTEFQQHQQLHRRDPSSSTAACGVRVASETSTIASLQSTINEPNAVQIVADVPMGCITFDSFVNIINQGRQNPTKDNDDDDSRFHFLCIVNQYQNRCDSEGKYLLAKDFMDQISSLQKEEENRVLGKVKDRLMEERAKILTAHEHQLDEFTQSWDEYMSGFEQKSEQYMDEMRQTHEQQLVSLRKNLTDEIENKPKKWSKDLIDCRRSLENVAKQASSGQTQLYREAQQIKQVADALHEYEKDDMNSKFNSLLCAKVRNLEKKQQAEMAALAKKIDTKRREVTKKREVDTLRLQQRNRNIVKMLDAKNKLECSRVASDIQLRIKRVLKQR